MKSPSSITTLWLLLAAVGMMWLPLDMQAALRLAVGDAMKPGCRVWSEVQSKCRQLTTTWRSSLDDSAADVRRLQLELDAAQQKTRQLELLLARQQETAAAHQPPLFAASSLNDRERLAVPVLIDAAVLCDHHALSWRKGRWLDQGKSAGLLEEAPILASTEPMLDVGRDAQLTAEDALVLGRSVIGKVHLVGRWSSTFLLTTDQGFRSRAQLVRETPDGFVFGAKGVLKGQGDALCRLEGVPATETVEIGNTVYTAERDGLLPTPLYYGQVVEATLDDRAKEWTVLVKPVAAGTLTKVQVLRTSLNSRRVLAN